MPYGTQHVPVRDTWHIVRTDTCNMALIPYRYVPFGTHIVPVRAIWHSHRTGTCHLALRTYRYVPSGTQNVTVLVIWCQVQRTTAVALCKLHFAVDPCSGSSIHRPNNRFQTRRSPTRSPGNAKSFPCQTVRQELVRLCWTDRAVSMTNVWHCTKSCCGGETPTDSGAPRIRRGTRLR